MNSKAFLNKDKIYEGKSDKLIIVYLFAYRLSISILNNVLRHIYL